MIETEIQDKPTLVSDEKRQQSIEKTLKCSAYPLTDMGNAERLADYFGHNLCYLWDTGQWLCFDGKRWNVGTGSQAAIAYAKQTTRLMIQEAAEKTTQPGREAHGHWAFGCEKESRITAMLKLTRSEKLIGAYRKDFDEDIYLFNTQTGIINLQSDKLSLMPHHSDFPITQIANTTFDENADCPLWLKSVNTWMGGNQANIDYLQQLFGMSLTGDNRSRVFPIFWGSGLNGKSTFLNTIGELMGEYAAIAPENLIARKLMQEHPTELASLAYKRLVVVDETRPNMKLRTSLIKRVSGDRTLSARFMRQNYFEYRNTAKIILCTNNLPVIDDLSDAVWDRLHLLEWPVRIPDDQIDPTLADKLKAEWPGILLWLIKGCQEWWRNGRLLNPPVSVKTATQNYRNVSDPMIDNFIEDNCILEASAYCSTKKLHEAYENWAAQNGVKAIATIKELSCTLRLRGCVIKQKRVPNEMGTEKNLKCACGISLVPETDKNDELDF